MTLFGSEASKVVKWGSTSLKLQMTSTLEVHRSRVLRGLTSLRQMTSTSGLCIIPDGFELWSGHWGPEPTKSHHNSLPSFFPPTSFGLFFGIVFEIFPRFRRRTCGFSRRASLILGSKCKDITCGLVLFHSSLVGYGSTTWGACFDCGVLVSIYWRACLF